MKKNASRIFLIFSLAVFAAVLGAAYIVFFGQSGFSFFDRFKVKNPNQYLIKAESKEPAAGICAQPSDGDETMVRIKDGMPDPRCQKIRPNQILVISNETGEDLIFWVGDRVEDFVVAGPEIEYAFDLPVGLWLEPGVHRINMEHMSGPEIWVLSE